MCCSLPTSDELSKSLSDTQMIVNFPEQNFPLLNPSGCLEFISTLSVQICAFLDVPYFTFADMGPLTSFIQNLKQFRIPFCGLVIPETSDQMNIP